MARIDRLKEEIGWLKLLFGVLVAVEVPLVGWLAQNYRSADTVLVVSASVAAALVILFLVWIQRSVYHRIQELEDA